MKNGNMQKYFGTNEYTHKNIMHQHKITINYNSCYFHEYNFVSMFVIFSKFCTIGCENGQSGEREDKTKTGIQKLLTTMRQWNVSFTMMCISEWWLEGAWLMSNLTARNVYLIHSSHMISWTHWISLLIICCLLRDL